VTLWIIFKTFLQIGLFSFGGGMAMLPLIQAQVVDIHGWMSAVEFIDTIGLAQVTPGPIALNAATLAGYKTAGVLGGAVATLGVVLPAFLISLLLAVFMGRVQGNRTYRRMLDLIQTVAAALILSTIIILWPGAVTGGKSFFLFAVTFGLLNLERFSPALVMVASGIAGVLLF